LFIKRAKISPKLNFLLKADRDLLQDKLAEIGGIARGLINSLNSKVVTNN